MTHPTVLGKVIRYFANAYQYGVYKAADTTRSPRVFYQALRLMAERDAYISTELLDTEAIAKLAITSSWFYSAVKLVADRCSSREAQFLVKKRVGEGFRDIKNHNFEKLLQRPNSLMTSEFLWSYIVWWLYLRGNGYVWIATDRLASGEPRELWPIPSDQIRPLPDTMRKSALNGTPIIDYEYIVQGQIFILPGEHIIHFRFPNPFDFWSGLSPVSAMLQSLRTDYNQGKHIEEHYGVDNAIPTAVISLPAEMDNDDFEAAQEQIREEFGGKRRSAIIRAGDFTIQTIAHTFQQSDIVNTRKFNRDAIYAVVGVPEGMISGNMSGDSRLATEIAFTRNTVQPLLDNMASVLTANVIPFYDEEEDHVIQAPIIIPQDRSMKINEYQAYSQDRTINENRMVLGLPPAPKTGIEVLDQMLEVPIRLFPYVSSNTFQAQQVDQYNIPEYTGSPDMPESISPENLQIEMSSEGEEIQGEMPEDVTRDSEAAVKIATREELKRWRKSALGILRRGKDPADKDFNSVAIEQTTIDSIRNELRGASDEEAVRTVFEKYLAD